MPLNSVCSPLAGTNPHDVAASGFANAESCTSRQCGRLPCGPDGLFKRDTYVRELGSVFISKPLRAFGALAASGVLVLTGGNWRYGGYALFAWIMYQAVRAQGHSDGYGAGYTDAHHATMKRMLGITDEEEKDLYERAIEMEIDNRVLSKFQEQRDDAG
jgi:hypothetical protein